jgi:hypothetical protein
MQEQQAAMLQALTQRPDPMQGMKETLGLMVMMREAMGIGAQSQSQSQPQGIAEALKLIRELREVSEEINPQPKSETDSLVGMLGPIVDLVKTQIGAGQQLPQAAQPISQITQPAPQVAHTPNPIPQTPIDQFITFINSLPPTEADKIMGELLKQLNDLLAMAASGKPATEGGAIIADKLPDELLDFLERPDCVDMLIALVPAAGAHRQWLIDAVTEANRILDEPEDEAPAPGAQSPAPTA